jgi:GNAT superfamily N-acetyltransferase
MSEISFRRAEESDLPAIVALLADDPLGQQREQPGLPLAGRYKDAFAAMDADPNQFLAVMVDGSRIVGTLQLTFIPGLSRNGAWRGQIEAVRISADRRRSELGRRMFEWAIAECRARGCSLVQLTTDKNRPDAHRFYERLGFAASHLGYKRAI